MRVSMSTVFFQWLYAFLLVLWCGYGWAGVFFFEDQLSLGFAEVGWSVAWVVGGGGEVALSRRWEMRCRRVETGIGSWHEFICASKVATMVCTVRVRPIICGAAVVILVTVGIITMAAMQAMQAMEAPAPITAVLQVLGGAAGIALQEAMGEVVDLALQEEAGEVLGVALRAVAGEVLEDAERDTYIGKRKDQYSVMKIMNNQALLRNANQKARNTDSIVKKLVR